MKKVILSIEGMTCSACSNGLEKYLNKQNKIKSATVNLVLSTASIEYEDDLTLDEIEKYIKEAGFKSLGQADFNQENENDIMPIIIYGIIVFLILYISMAHMFHLPMLKFLDLYENPVNHSLVLLILTIIMLVYGLDILKSGIKNFIHKMPNMDTLVTLGVIASFSYSLFNVIMIIRGKVELCSNLYFESSSFIIYFIKLGRLIDKNGKVKTKDAIKKLVKITPSSAKKRTGDEIKEITIDEVKKGDILICFAGDKIAVDGEIIKGKAHFDEAFITGESKPILKKKNDSVIAGSINYDGRVEYKAIKIGKESTISEIVNLVLEATNTKAPIALLADKISGLFVPFIIIIALLTFIICLLVKVPINESILRFVSVLVVACPCALGLATPLAIVVSEGVCAKNNILVKSSKTFEIVSNLDTIVFDKTGTLTNGNLTVSKIYNYSNMEDNEIFSILGTIEQSSTHPIAKCILKYNSLNNIKLQENFDVTVLQGKGLKALNNQKTYYVGNEKILKDLNIPNNHLQDETILKENGNSIIYVTRDKEILALIGVKDTLKKEAKKVIKSLQKMNLEVMMLTGDNEKTASIIARETGIQNIIASVVPKEKSEFIKKLTSNNKKVMMVGDGINDAPSLTIADIGVSLSSGTDIAADASDVILMNNNLENIVNLINISKKTLKIIKQNLFWAFIYNLLMIPVAIGLFSKWNIKINPMIACIAMILSSFFVTFNSLRLRK